MVILQIGENAGRVWSVLDQCVEITISRLKSELDIQDPALFAAIGWLAREGKIFCCDRDGELYLSNKMNPEFYHFG